MANASIADRWIEAATVNDLDTLAELAHVDLVVTYPQSGEVIRGRDAYLAMMRAYPRGPATVESGERTGPRDRVHVSRRGPFTMPIITVDHGGDTQVYEARVRYPDGVLWPVVGVIEVRQGKVISERSYFCTPFEPPEWRTEFTEPSE